MDKEMIEKLKRNERAWMFLSKKEKGCLLSAPSKSVEYLSAIGEDWQENDGNFDATDVYRIAPDYQPEPEVYECEVRKTDTDRLDFHYQMDDWYLHFAVNFPDFIGYKYADGDVRCSPRRSNDPDRPAEIPTHVLFRRVK